MTFDPEGKSSLFHSRFAIIKSLLEGYDGTLPLHHYLGNAFRRHKNFGSRDRKIYTEWCYTFFRLGKALQELPLEIRLAVSWWLVHGNEDPLFNFLWNETGMQWPIDDDAATPNGRIDFVKRNFSSFLITDLFPFRDELSGSIARSDWAASMLIQPRVWIRIGEGNRARVEKELIQAQIIFETDDQLPGALSFEPRVKLNELKSFKDGSFEIQDRSSQLCGLAIPAKPGEHWWDCCSGAGGKSLQLLDRVPGIKITATDARATILENFLERTRHYRRQTTVKVVDLEQEVPESLFSKASFDGIVADVPCSGSGTWARNPENLTFFRESELEMYVQRQRTIISQTVPYLKPGGSFVYITCSVFKKENEEMMEWILQNTPLKLVKSQTVDGREHRADTMFSAVME